MRRTPLRLPGLAPGRRVRLPVLLLALAPLAALSAVIPMTLTVSASTVPASPADWSTVFSDNFSGPAGSPVDSQWTYDTGTHYNSSGCPQNWGTGEVDTATKSAANVSEDGSGHLNITAVNSGGSWTSGRIETVADNFAAPAGGELEVSGSIKQPSPANGLGYWPAFWMLGAGYRASGAGTSGTMHCSNWPSTGEIDVMEDVNALSEHSGTLHCGTDPNGPCNEPTGITSGLQSCPGCQTGYNTYSVVIDRTRTSNESITWYLNGNAYSTVTENQVGAAAWQAAVDHGFFLILDLAMGGGYPNGVCKCTSPSASTTSGAAMSVSYVAVYQTNGTSGASPNPSPPSPGKQCATMATAGISADCYTGSLGLGLGVRGHRGHKPLRGRRQPGGAVAERRLSGVSGHQLRQRVTPVLRAGDLGRPRRGQRAGAGGPRQPAESGGRGLHHRRHRRLDLVAAHLREYHPGHRHPHRVPGVFLQRHRRSAVR